MMNANTKRRLFARLLLSVFVPMLLLASLHVHNVTPAAGDCTECVEHVPHSGHVSLNVIDVHDCVLCQLTSLPLLMAVAVELAALVLACTAGSDYLPQPVSSGAGRLAVPRAPPVS